MEAAVAALESTQYDHSIVIEPEMIEQTIDDGDLPTDPVDVGRSEDGDDAWPTVPVWIWLRQTTMKTGKRMHA
ncbi:hypothetical protein [Kribbella sp. VKM Ac-2568]|uniref:hypothetical protein n=1 Tax=Kribbella sp. VKM Ac-2568 TaxID=2512219 RepID=UPI00104F08A6|nr:hypothetical protein [Kribbella sp. VKM Ac-2568]TCM34425.1 hypothetical protein EV648_1278 [Kribbella sp. VKM Ac-2568]